MAKITKVKICGCKVAIKSAKDVLLVDTIQFTPLCEDCCKLMKYYILNMRQNSAKIHIT